jgi:hypothetical protein
MDDRYWSWTFLDARPLLEPLQAGVSMDRGSWKETVQAGIRDYEEPMRLRQRSTSRALKHEPCIDHPPNASRTLAPYDTRESLRRRIVPNIERWAISPCLLPVARSFRRQHLSGRARPLAQGASML